MQKTRFVHDKKSVFFVICFCLMMAQLNSPVMVNAQEMIRRTVAILPVVNTTDQKDLTALGQLIRHAVRSNMLADEQFFFVNFSTIDAKASELKYSANDFSSDEKSINLSLATGADVVVMSYLVMEESDIVLYSDALDILTGETLVTVRIVGKRGISRYRFVEQLASELAGRMKSEYPMISKSELENLMKQQTMVIEEADQEIIEKLLRQKTRYQEYQVKRKGKVRRLAVPFGKNVLIFVNNQYDDYTVETGGKIFNSKQGLKIIAFDSQPGIYRDFVITRKGQRPQKYRYRQKEEYEISRKVLVFDEEEPYRVFIDAGGHVGIYSDEVGIDFRVGFGLPPFKSLNDNLYFRLSLNTHYDLFAHDRDIKDIFDGDMFPRVSFMVGAGYEHIFLLPKNLIGIHIGAEAGYKMSLVTYLVQSLTGDIYKFPGKAVNIAYPSFYLALPFGVEFMARRKVSLLIGVEPTFRVVFHAFSNEGELYNDEPLRLSVNNYDATLGYSTTTPIVQRYGSISIHWFFYNVPVTIAARIRI
jgi:hypothetical protein